MRLVTYSRNDGTQRLGFVPRTDDTILSPRPHSPVVDVANAARALGLAPLPDSMAQCVTLSATEPALLERLAELERRVGDATALNAECVQPYSAVRLCVPLARPPRNVLCIGANYVDHIKELDASFALKEGAQFPTVFTKPYTALLGPCEPLCLDAAVSEKFDYEVELAVIIGKGGKNIPEERALEHVFGYSVINDVTARDLQRTTTQWYVGKGVDATSSMGPWVVLADSLPAPQRCAISCRVNGEVRQSSHTSHMLFSVARIIHLLSSSGSALLPGDIIATGTPSGVGMSLTPPRFLQAGDVIELEVEHVGLLRTAVAAAQGA